MIPQFEIDSRGLNRAMAGLASLQATGEDMKDVLGRIGAFGVAETSLTFAESRDPYGKAWLPLSESAILSRLYRRGGARKARRGYRLRTQRGGTRAGVLRAIARGFQPLVDTGRLRNSIGYKVNRNYVMIGTNVVYGGIHQRGGKVSSGRNAKIPARPYLPDQRGLPGPWGAAFHKIVREKLAQIVAKK